MAPSESTLLPFEHLGTYRFLWRFQVIDARSEGTTLTVSGAARLLGVHVNTVRAWTDQGRLRCVRINDRGDRRYQDRDLLAFLADAGLQATRPLPFQSRLRPATGRHVTLDTSGVVPAADQSLVDPGDAPRGPLGGNPATAPSTPAGRTPGRAPSGQRDEQAEAARLLRAVGGLARAHSRGGDLEAALRGALRLLRDTGRFSMLAVGQWQDGRLAARLSEGSYRMRTWWRSVDQGLARVCCAEERPIAASVIPEPEPGRPGGTERGPVVQVYAPIGSREAAWGVLVTEAWPSAAIEGRHLDLLAAIADVLSMAADRDALAATAARGRALTQATRDLGSLPETPVILRRLVEHTSRLLDVQHVAVLERAPDGTLSVPAAVGIPPGIPGITCGAPEIIPLLSDALTTGHAAATADLELEVTDADVREALGAAGLRAAAIEPLAVRGESLGALAVFRARATAWNAEDLELLHAIAGQAGVALGNARDLERTATWAAQLQSIQALGARLGRLSTVSEIGQAICLELRGLIDHHNVRVYRVAGDEVLPIAWRGEIGGYTGEHGEQLRLQVGRGITGWVAQHGVAEYLPNASADARAETIPGTEDDLEESMLLAPMRYNERVIGVIVLSRLGLDRFSADHLRYLEIYASMAAQALANADAAERLTAQSDRLERQLETQRELIRITESILSSLDPHTVVTEIADRLGALVHADALRLDLYDAGAGSLVPLHVRGVDAEHYLGRTLDDVHGVAGWVARHGEAQLVEDELADPRVAEGEGVPHPGALIVAPLHGRRGVTGVLSLERLGVDARFEPWEYELVTLFAGHVSIALANAVTHQAVERRAMTDALTGLKNQGTFADELTRAVALGAPFALLILDLDDFKSFNDRHGHEAGNRLLQSIARSVAEADRETDEAYRYGGDEIAVILPGTRSAGAVEVARRVGAAVRATDPAEVTCSIGVAVFPDDAADRDGLLLAADRACYVAKRSGRARLVTAAEAEALPAETQIPPPTPMDDEVAG